MVKIIDNDMIYAFSMMFPLFSSFDIVIFEFSTVKIMFPWFFHWKTDPFCSSRNSSLRTKCSWRKAARSAPQSWEFWRRWIGPASGQIWWALLRICCHFVKIKKNQNGIKWVWKYGIWFQIGCLNMLICWKPCVPNTCFSGLCSYFCD